MPPHTPMLHMMCGKPAAGKSTLATRLSQTPGTLLLAEDAWLKALFAEEMATPADYLRCSTKLRAIIGPHVCALLAAGVSVVLDFPANTLAQRDWMRGLLATSGAAHRLHVLEAPDDLCLARLHARNAAGDHPFQVNEAQFRRFTVHFVPPTPEEGFTIVLHRA